MRRAAPLSSWRVGTSDRASRAAVQVPLGRLALASFGNPFFFDLLMRIGWATRCASTPNPVVNGAVNGRAQRPMCYPRRSPVFDRATRPSSARVQLTKVLMFTGVAWNVRRVLAKTPSRRHFESKRTSKTGSTSKIGSRNGFVRFGKICIVRSLSPYGVLSSGH